MRYTVLFFTVASLFCGCAHSGEGEVAQSAPEALEAQLLAMNNDMNRIMAQLAQAESVTADTLKGLIDHLYPAMVPTWGESSADAWRAGLTKIADDGGITEAGLAKLKEDLLKRKLTDIQQVRNASSESSLRAGDKRIMEIPSIGYGESEEEATENAFRDALNEAISSIIGDAAMRTHDNEIEKRILRYPKSHGHGHYELLIDQGEKGVGVVVGIVARVDRSRLVKRIREFYPNFIDADELRDSAVKAMEDKSEKTAEVQALIAAYPQNVWVWSIVKGPYFDEKTNRVALDIKWGIDQRKFAKFAAGLSAALRKLCGKPTQDACEAGSQMPSYRFPGGMRPAGASTLSVCMGLAPDKVRKNRQISNFNVFVVPFEVRDMMAEMVTRTASVFITVYGVDGKKWPTMESRNYPLLYNQEGYATNAALDRPYRMTFERLILDRTVPFSVYTVFLDMRPADIGKIEKIDITLGKSTWAGLPYEAQVARHQANVKAGKEDDFTLHFNYEMTAKLLPPQFRP